jgi:integrase
MAWTRALWTLHRPEAWRSGKAHVARRQLGSWRDCVHDAQDWATRCPPLVRPLSDYLASLPASDNPNAYIFPRAASAKRTASLSNQFRDILAEAGLVEPRGHQARKQGRAHTREASEISFNSLRHSAVTMLKASGLSDVFAREIVGHESAAVSRQYTHLSTDDLRTAMQRLPDVTDTNPAKQKENTK